MFLKQHILLASLVLPTLLAAGCAALPGGKASTEPTGRLLIADPATRSFHALDLQDGTSQHLRLPRAVSTLYSSGKPDHVLGVNREGDQVLSLHTGIRYEDHGDHDHWYRQSPRLSHFLPQGPRPTHLVTTDSGLAIFYDGRADESHAEVWFGQVSERGRLEGQKLELGSAKHGAAVVTEQGVWVSTRSQSNHEGLPDQLSFFAGNTGAPMHDQQLCDGLHGAAANADWVGFGCNKGVWVHPQISTAGQGHLILHPEGFDPSSRVGTLWAPSCNKALLGAAGSQFWWVDAEQSTMSPVASFNNLWQGHQAGRLVSTHSGLIAALNQDGDLYVTELGSETTRRYRQVMDLSNIDFDTHRRLTLIEAIPGEALIIGHPTEHRAVWIDLARGKIFDLALPAAGNALSWVPNSTASSRSIQCDA